MGRDIENNNTAHFRRGDWANYACKMLRRTSDIEHVGCAAADRRFAGNTCWHLHSHDNLNPETQKKLRTTTSLNPKPETLNPKP